MINKQDELYIKFKRQFNNTNFSSQVYNDELRNSARQEHIPVIKYISEKLKLDRNEFFSYYTSEHRDTDGKGDVFGYIIKAHDGAYIEIILEVDRNDECTIKVRNEEEIVKTIPMDLTVSVNDAGALKIFEGLSNYILTGDFDSASSALQIGGAKRRFGKNRT